MEVIKALYTEVFVLEEWLYQADYSGTLKAGLLKEEDTQR